MFTSKRRHAPEQVPYVSWCLLGVQLIALLESAGVSRANPYNIVPQGKVNALVLTKDAGRLDMLKDIAGINTYDERRAESMAMMDETRDKQSKVNDSLNYIDTRLLELQGEKEELVQAQALDKKRKVLEYTFYDEELKKAKTDLDKMDAQRSKTYAPKKSARAGEWHR